VIGAVFHTRTIAGSSMRIDYLGATLIAGTMTCIVLLTKGGGLGGLDVQVELPRGFAVLIALSIRHLLLLWLAEQGAEEPIPPALALPQPDLTVCEAMGSSSASRSLRSVSSSPSSCRS